MGIVSFLRGILAELEARSSDVAYAYRESWGWVIIVCDTSFYLGSKEQYADLSAKCRARAEKIVIMGKNNPTEKELTALAENCDLITL